MAMVIGLLTRGGEEGRHLVFLHDPPECRAIRRPDGLAFEEDRRSPGEKRRVEDV